MLGAQDEAAFLNADQNGPHTPGPSVAAARWLADERSITGFGVETVGIDAGSAGAMDPAFPAHNFLLGADTYGLTQLQNLDRLPSHRGRAGGDALADRRGQWQPGARGGPGRALMIKN